MATDRLPQMPLFVDDFEADTAHLSLEEDGAYNRLLRLCWRQSDCSVPDDRDWLIRRMRVDSDTFDRVVTPIINEFFRRSGGRIWQKRQRKEHDYVIETRKRRSEAGSKGGHAKSQKSKETEPSKATAEPQPGQSQATAEPQPGSSKIVAPHPTPPHPFKEEEESRVRAREELPSDISQDALCDAVLDAVGINPSAERPTYWMPPFGPKHVEKWRTELDLTPGEIVLVASRSRNGRPPPDGPKALDRAMQIFAGQKGDPGLDPVRPNSSRPRYPPPSSVFGEGPERE